MRRSGLPVLLAFVAAIALLRTSAAPADKGDDAQSEPADDAKAKAVSDEFDKPPDFKTVPPEGPSASTARDNDNKAPVTSILVAPSENGRLATIGASPHPAPPGMNHANNHVFRANREPILQAEAAKEKDSEAAKNTCQYIFTVDSSANCPHAKTEVAVQHSPLGAGTEELNEYVQRLLRLEIAVYGSGQKSSKDGGGAKPQENVNDTNASSDEEGRHKNLSRITELMQKGLTELVNELQQLESERKALKVQNVDLALKVRRATELEETIQNQRDENLKMLRANRNLTTQNRILRKSKKTLERIRDSFRGRIRSLNTQKEKLSTEVDECQGEKLVIVNENNHLKMRLGNLTEVVGQYMEISRGEDALHFELENEIEKNEVLTARNTRLEEDLLNATNKIRKLLQKIPEVVEIPAYDEEGEISHDSDVFIDEPVPEDATIRMEAGTTDLSTSTLKPGAGRSTGDNEETYSYCGRLTSVSGPETVRESRSFLQKYGVWAADPLQTMGADRIWSIDTTKERVRELKQYENLRKFTLHQPENIITLPVPVESTGGVIYNGSLYYQRRNSRKLIRYDIRSKTVLKERPAPHAGFHGMYAYQWGGFTDIDLAVDELGLWVIYSTRQNKGNIVVSKLNPVTLVTSFTMKTTIPKRRVANAFMICGVLYTVDSHKAANASINFAFDTKTRQLKRLSIPFFNQYRYNVMIDYNPRRREIFSWDNHHQVKYYVTLDNSLGKISEMSQQPRRRRGS